MRSQRSTGATSSALCVSQALRLLLALCFQSGLTIPDYRGQLFALRRFLRSAVYILTRTAESWRCQALDVGSPYVLCRCEADARPIPAVWRAVVSECEGRSTVCCESSRWAHPCSSGSVGCWFCGNVVPAPSYPMEGEAALSSTDLTSRSLGECVLFSDCFDSGLDSQIMWRFGHAQ